MIDAQLRAARSMLKWTLKVASGKSDVHRNTIAGIESGGTKPNHRTEEALRGAYEKGGVEFGEDGSVRLKQNEQRKIKEQS